MVRSLRESVQASRDQDWLKTNLASIGSMMQGHRDLEVVAELIMEELAPLLGAQHGTFFLSRGVGRRDQAAADRRATGCAPTRTRRSSTGSGSR